MQSLGGILEKLVFFVFHFKKKCREKFLNSRSRCRPGRDGNVIGRLHTSILIVDVSWIEDLLSKTGSHDLAFMYEDFLLRSICPTE